MSRFETGMEGMVDIYVFETTGLLEQLDNILISTETGVLASEDVAEIFRIMHTIKGSSAMMGLSDLAQLAHSFEDLFYIIREKPELSYNKEALYELLFECLDSFRDEIAAFDDEDSTPGDFSVLLEKINSFAAVMKGEAPKENSRSSNGEDEIFEECEPESVKAVKVIYEKSCLMPGIRAMLLLRSLKSVCQIVGTIPDDVDDDSAGDIISQNGLYIKVICEDSEKKKEIEEVFGNSLNIESFCWVERKNPKNKKEISAEKEPDLKAEKNTDKKTEKNKEKSEKKPSSDSIISVKLSKLDVLLDLVSEIVICQSAVCASPDIKALNAPLENFSKSTRQLKKLTDELQDIVMSIRMVPVASAFAKMNRVVRDMNSKLKKNVELVVVGGDTEADKSVVDMLNDPLMHLVRNAVDHGIEAPEEREKAGKTEPARVTLSAYEESGEVVIKVCDNGAGMDPDKLLNKAEKNGILTKPRNEYTKSEALNLIMQPGFSTNEQITEYSGRGVGMDVVVSNIEKVGGKITVESEKGVGSTFVIKIPLSLSIIEALSVRVGKSAFCIPILNVRESFRAKNDDVVCDDQGNFVVKLRGRSFHAICLSQAFGIKSDAVQFKDGIMILCEADGKKVCLFADEIVSDMSVVVKPFSPLLNRYGVKENGMIGCSVLGDGSITIILDVKTVFDKFL